MTNYLLWYNIPIEPYGNILVSVYVGVIGYSIFKLRFMDIHLAFRYMTINFYLSVLIGTPIAFSIWWFSQSVGAAVIGFFAPITGYVLFRKWKPGTTEAFVFAGKYALHKDENIRNYKESIVNSSTLRDWAENLCRSMQKLFDVNEVVVLLFDSSRHYYASLYGVGVEQISWGLMELENLAIGKLVEIFNLNVSSLLLVM
jgi:hypothetical protein